jgi:uncharacterized membrane protein
MRTLMIAALLLASCGRGQQPASPVVEAGINEAGSPASEQPARGGWDLQSSGEGAALALLGVSGETVVRLFCPAGQHRLLVNVPAFRAIGSEERLSFGSGSEAVALVADTRGDAQRGGVSGTGPVPDNLAALVGGPLSVSYGSQSSGPHTAPPADLARAFTGACSQAPPAEQPPPGGATSAGACRMQDGKVISPNLLRAVGTEPFWGARIDGRCVTYSHPENQVGTRIWTQFTGTRDNGVWTGFYANQRFVLRTRPQPGCSDGMSDRRYPIAVSLTVAGEERSGCAELP